MLEQWRHAHMAFVSCSSDSLPSQLGRWKKPNNDSLKCNFDAAVNREDQQVGCGFIIRNEVLKGEMDAFMAEALSYKLTLEWLREKNYSCVIVESDRLCLVQALQNGTT